MSSQGAIEMDEEERDEFLGTGGTGVIAFSTAEDGAPHAIPVSYGYDSTDVTFYFRLAVGPDSRKGDVEGQAVSFVTHGDEDGSWRSVVAEGRLERTTDEEIATETLQGLDRVRIPLFDVFERPPGRVPFEFYRLVPDELTGRKESTTRS
jgi:hypothetical protein